MSKYTTEVRFICEMAAGLTESVGYNNVSQVIHASHASVIGDYPIFDESYRETLDTKILKHYYTREISEETVGLWKLRLNTRMNEIMPYYNKLYSSELLSFNPFYDVDLTTERIRNEDTEGNLKSTTKDSRIDNKISGSEIERNSEGNIVRQDTKAGNNDSERNIENNESIQNSRASINDSERSGEINETTQSNKTNSNDRERNSDSSETLQNNRANTSSTENISDKSSSSASANESHNGVNVNSESNDVKSHTDKYSDTPQGGISGLESDTYLTNARIIDEDDLTKQNTSQQSDAIGKTDYNENERQSDSGHTVGNEQINSKASGENNDKEHMAGSEQANGATQTSNSDTTKTSENEQSNSTRTSENTDKIVSSTTEQVNSVGRNSENDATKSTSSENSQTHGNGERNDENSITSTEDYLEHVHGRRGGMSYAKLLMEYRESFINIDKMIIEELSDLFFGLW